MEIQLEKPALNNFKAYVWQKKNLDGEFEVKNFSYSYSLFKGNHSMERKIIEYGIILLYKYKVKQTEVASRSLFTFLLTNYKNVWSYRIFTVP